MRALAAESISTWNLKKTAPVSIFMSDELSSAAKSKHYRHVRKAMMVSLKECQKETLEAHTQCQHVVGDPLTAETKDRSHVSSRVLITWGYTRIVVRCKLHIFQSISPHDHHEVPWHHKIRWLISNVLFSSIKILQRTYREMFQLSHSGARNWSSFRPSAR